MCIESEILYFSMIDLIFLAPSHSPEGQKNLPMNSISLAFSSISQFTTVPFRQKDHSSECHPSSISNNVSCSVATVGGARHVLLWILTGHRANMSVVPCLALRALMCWGWLQLVSCQSVFSGLDQNQVEHPLAQTPLGLFALLRD